MFQGVHTFCVDVKTMNLSKQSTSIEYYAFMNGKKCVICKYMLESIKNPYDWWTHASTWVDFWQRLCQIFIVKKAICYCFYEKPHIDLTRVWNPFSTRDGKETYEKSRRNFVMKTLQCECIHILDEFVCR